MSGTGKFIAACASALTLIAVGIAIGATVGDDDSTSSNSAASATPSDAPTEGLGEPNQTGVAEPAPERLPAEGDCTVYQQGRGAAINVSGPGAFGACEELTRELGQRGQLWTQEFSCDATGGADCDTRKLVCTAMKDDLALTITDTGSAMTGQRFCAAYAGDGWEVSTDGDN